jgi:hypothetical protein
MKTSIINRGGILKLKWSPVIDTLQDVMEIINGHWPEMAEL